MTSPDPAAGLTFHEPAAPVRFRDLLDVWRYRELLLLLTARDLTVRYRQAVIGVAWAVLQPLATVGVFLTLFALLGKRPAAGDAPYPLVVLTGALPWQLFAGTVNYAGVTLVHNAGLIGKVYFPRVLLPAAAALTNLVDFAIGGVALAAGLVYFGVAPGWPMLFLPAVVLLAVLTSLGVGLWAAALNALYRDVGILVPFLLQLGFFVTPVMYESAALVPPSYRPLVALNPMVGVVEGFRWAVLGGDPPVLSVAVAAAVAGAVLAGGWAYFRRVERVLTDRI
jgi:lipopolysaccharide transport system permease protein